MNHQHQMSRRNLYLFGLGVLAALSTAVAQSPTDLVALKGLAPVGLLSRSDAGKAALAANYIVTGGIQTGAVRQSTLLPFTEQRQQALRDAAITGGNLEQLADGLGTALGAAYVARAHYTSRVSFTSISPSVKELIAYANVTSGMNSNAAKYFFANATTDGKKPVSAEGAALLKETGAETDVFGKSYNLPAGSPGANPYGDSRPFQTETKLLPFVGLDYFGSPSGTEVYSRGPVMNLINSPSYPSGHTTYGYTGALLLALLVPERYQQMIARGAEYGNDRILVGAHYAMDILGGRTLALYDMAHLLANDPKYVGHETNGSKSIPNFQMALKSARNEVRIVLEAACGNTIQECAHEDTSRLSDDASNEAFYSETQTYSLPIVHPAYAAITEDIAVVAPEAGYLLTAAYPSLTLDQADQILTETEGPGGGFLDDGSSFGVYSRINLYKAAGIAKRTASSQPPK